MTQWLRMWDTRVRAWNNRRACRNARKRAAQRAVREAVRALAELDSITREIIRTRHMQGYRSGRDVLYGLPWVNPRTLAALDTIEKAERITGVDMV